MLSRKAALVWRKTVPTAACSEKPFVYRLRMARCSMAGARAEEFLPAVATGKIAPIYGDG
jgi:hypothetical protein